MKWAKCVFFLNCKLPMQIIFVCVCVCVHCYLSYVQQETNQTAVMTEHSSWLQCCVFLKKIKRVCFSFSLWRCCEIRFTKISEWIGNRIYWRLQATRAESGRTETAYHIQRGGLWNGRHTCALAHKHTVCMWLMMFTDIKFSIIYLVAQQSGFCVDISDAWVCCGFLLIHYTCTSPCETATPTITNPLPF